MQTERSRTLVRQRQVPMLLPCVRGDRVSIDGRRYLGPFGIFEVLCSQFFVLAGAASNTSRL